MRQVGGGGQVCDTGEHRLTAEIKGAGKTKRRRWAEIKIKTKASKKIQFTKKKKLIEIDFYRVIPIIFYGLCRILTLDLMCLNFTEFFFVYFQLIFKWRFKF